MLWNFYFNRNFFSENTTLIWDGILEYFLSDDSVQFLPKFLDFSGMWWTDLVSRILAILACWQELNLCESWPHFCIMYFFSSEKASEGCVQAKGCSLKYKDFIRVRKRKYYFLTFNFNCRRNKRESVNSSKAYFIIPSILTFLLLPQ